MRRHFGRIALIVVALGVLAGRAQAPAAGLSAVQLKCEYRANPLGVDTRQPRFSWVLESGKRGDAQQAYQILVASSPDELKAGRGDLWDSGKVSSSESVHVVYQGKPLKSGQRAHWKVRVWDASGKASGFSARAWFEMGLLDQTDWKAKWITDSRPAPASEVEMFGDNPAPLFRNEFAAGKKVARARVFVSGLGHYELRLNGRKVGDHVLDPGWTAYSKGVLYSTYDVTSMIAQGQNAIGVTLGNGWYNPLPLKFWGHVNIRESLTIGKPRFILQLRIDYSDGTAETVVSDETWKTSPGPLLRNNLYLGEVYDARLEKNGWDKPGYDAAGWAPAVLATEPIGPLRAQSAPPIRATRTLKPVRVTEPKPGVFIFDMGQNFAGWVTLRAKGEAGTRVTLRYGELVYPDGTLNGMTAVCGQIKGGGKDYRYDGKGVPKTAFQQDVYILKGGGEEAYTPQFTFHGFRYVEVTGYPGKPRLGAIEGLRLNSDVSPAGNFECSNETFNRIQQMVLWTELSNLFSVESDCPHREKFGYGGDIVAAGEMAMLNFNMSRFYAKAVDDLADAVRPNGGFTETAPFVGIADQGLGEKSGPIGWGTAHPFLLWNLYQYYGDRRLLEEQYEALKRWIDLLRLKAVDGILDNGISDHESLAPKPRALTGTAFFYYNVQLFFRIAFALDRQADAAQAMALGQHIKAAFNKKFLDPNTGRYDTGSQACQAFALYMGLVPPEHRDKVLDALVKDIRESHKGHLTTGIFGTKYMLGSLADQGRGDVAYEIVNQRTFPGWGYMLDKGATTLWEHWEFSDNTFSHNHPMFGSVSEWFYKGLGGIRPAADAVGFNSVVIAPGVLPDLKWVKASYDSVRGKVVSEWKRDGNSLELRVCVPVGVKATVIIPAVDIGSVRERGRQLERVPEIKLVRFEQQKAVISIGSGEYRFSSGLEQ